jgi:hypothetical protein
MFQLRRLIGSSCRISTTKGLAVIDKKKKKKKKGFSAMASIEPMKE